MSDVYKQSCDVQSSSFKHAVTYQKVWAWAKLWLYPSETNPNFSLCLHYVCLQWWSNLLTKSIPPSVYGDLERSLLHKSGGGGPEEYCTWASATSGLAHLRETSKESTYGKLIRLKRLLWSIDAGVYNLSFFDLSLTMGCLRLCASFFTVYHNKDGWMLCTVRGSGTE